jgi:hypothetical protein
MNAYALWAESDGDLHGGVGCGVAGWVCDARRGCSAGGAGGWVDLVCAVFGAGDLVRRAGIAAEVNLDWRFD